MPGLAFPPGQVQAWAGIPSRSSPGLGGWHSLQVKSRPGLAFPPGQDPQGQVWEVCDIHAGQVYICQPAPGINLKGGQP